ncbi:MAG: hypothetical protein IH599_01155 [Bacteroidales bacterium]|nr:hypothetical protein [Bacteroidales bacterium]
MGHFGSRLLSYVKEQVIESFDSEFSGRLDVSLVNGRQVLNSPSSNYSFGTLHKVFRTALDAEGLKLIELSPVLILGLGAGSVVHILHQEWKYDVKITGVEKDAAVLAAGKKYFGLGDDPLLEIVKADAQDYVTRCSNPFGLVIVDLFIGKDVPSQFEEDYFWSRLGRLVKSPGMLIFNKMVYDEQTRAQSAHLQDLAQKNFEQVRVRRIAGPWENHIIIGENVKE